MTVAILIFGASIGCVDVAMNLQAVLVERGAGRPIMSGFHGLYSLGGLLGAAAASALLSIGDAAHRLGPGRGRRSAGDAGRRGPSLPQNRR